MKYELADVNGVRCPVCGAISGKRLYRVTSRQAAQHFCRVEVDQQDHDTVRAEIERLWGRDNAQVVRCDQCGFCYADPFVAGSATFYATTLKDPDYPSWRYEFGRTIGQLPRILGEFDQPRLLELGAGDGAFIRQVTPALLPKDRVVCTEYSAPAAQAIREYGVTCEMLDPMALKQAGYDNFAVVCLFQVLEHLDKLDDFFQSITALTRPEAALFIGVPNGEFQSFCEQNGGLLDMPPNHVGRWNRRSFEIIGARNGWSLVDHAFEPARFSEVLRGAGDSRFAQARLRHGSLANLASTSRRRIVRRMLGIPLLLVSYVRTVPVAFRNRNRPLGSAQWAYLRRQG